VTYENREFKWYVLRRIWYLLTTGVGEALGLVHLRLLRVYLIYALAAGASSEPGDVSVYAVFRSRLIIPFHFYFLMFAHKIWRGG
jgi:hypothetical protein